MSAPALAALKRAGATKPHGTRVRYIAGCKCLLCRAANSRYETGRYRQRANGDWNGIVSAETARHWIEHLASHGIGARSISECSSVGRTIVNEIRSGEKQRIRKRTERRILAVDTSARAGGALVPAYQTWRKLDELVSLGYTKKWIAQQLGLVRQIQFRTDRIKLKTAIAVKKLALLIAQGKVSR